MAQSIAVICGTVDQQTMQMAAQLATKFQQAGYHIEIYEGEQMPENFRAAAYDAVILGATMVGDDFPMELNRLVRHYRAELHEISSGFFATRDDSASAEEGEEENLAFAERTQWYPVVMANFSSDHKDTDSVVQRMDFAATGRRRMGQIDTENDYHALQPGSLDLFMEEIVEHIEYAREHPEMPLGPAGAR